MIDCYRVLGVSPHASQDEIRAAYIARMKVLHPDARGDGGGDDASAGDISAAYWQLRTRDRRSDHDRRLFASTLLEGANRCQAAPRRRLLPILNGQAARLQRRERAPRMLRGAAVTILVLALAAPAGLFWFAHLNPIEPARASAKPSLTAAAAVIRRPLDAVMRAAAADDFATVLRDFGLPGARTFSRRCLAELSARASLTMLDYCIAFDDAAASWERPREVGARGERFFADDQRASLYHEIAGTVQEPEVRRAMLQEASFFGRGPVPGALNDAQAEISAL